MNCYCSLKLILHLLQWRLHQFSRGGLNGRKTEKNAGWEATGITAIKLVVMRAHHRWVSVSALFCYSGEHRFPIQRVTAPWLTANTAVHWGEKCVFYQAESRLNILRGCMQWMNNEAKNSTINLSLCCCLWRCRESTGKEGCSRYQCSAPSCKQVRL